MDSTYEDEEDSEAAAMAAAMDAFVDGQELASLDKGGKKGQGSGGNTMPLGKTRIFGSISKNKGDERVVSANQEQIDLGEEEDGPRYIDTSLPPPVEEEGDGPRYMDTSQPAPAVLDEEAREMQARIDAILANVESSESTEAPHLHDLPQRPSFNSQDPLSDSNFMPSESRPGFKPGNSRDAFIGSVSPASSKPSNRQKGQRNENWYVDYYDPSFNENPWDRLEKEKGLEPLGEWLDYQGTWKRP